MNETIQQMLKKFKSYRNSYLKHEEKFKELAEHGQHPETLIIACVDSRIDPAILFNAALGELLVIRTKANIVPAYDSAYPREQVAAALEFAVNILQVKNIIVMGHSDCGGINFLVNQMPETKTCDSYISTWLEPLIPLKEKTQQQNPQAKSEELCKACEKANTIQSYQNLATYPWIKQKLKEKSLDIFAWYFNLSECQIEKYDPNKKTFINK